MSGKERWIFCSGIIMLSFLLVTSVAIAHFGVIIPSDDIITAKDSKKITLNIKFIHPMEDVYMEMEKPKKVAVLHHEQQDDLTQNLVAKKGKGKSQDKSYTCWETSYTVKNPGTTYLS